MKIKSFFRRPVHQDARFSRTSRRSRCRPSHALRPLSCCGFELLEDRTLLSLCSPTGLETLLTDKADYAPGETVHMTGDGYGAAATSTSASPAPIVPWSPATAASPPAATP
ncbi:MAG: hypothetical protein HY000_28975 [Planctomycetes bacterium]|nr:hypothetical protein [Planctomycetota bacterium]